MVVTTLAEFQLLVGGIAILPFIYYRLLVGHWVRSSNLEMPIVVPNDLPNISLVIPAWNEELLIEAKLDSLAQQEYPRDKIEVIFIDSSSTDGTLAIVKAWLNRNKDEFPQFSIVEMDLRKGKTAAISLAFAAAQPKSEILAMTDVDARLDAGCLLRLGAWFCNPEIGAVGATPLRFSGKSSSHGSGESTYRDLFSLQRLGESARDSTPFLEGSLMGIRRTAYSADCLNITSNADDAQLAVAARLAGLRAIQDEKMIFREPIPPTYQEHREQKVRRAQGLQRLLWRNRQHWFARVQGHWGKVLGMQGIMHMLMPWLVLIGCLFAVLKWCLLLTQPEMTLLVILSLGFDAWFFGGWILLRTGVRLPFLRLPAVFLDSMFSLLIAQFKLLSGESLHMWSQSKGVRKSWLLDSDSN